MILMILMIGSIVNIYINTEKKIMKVIPYSKQFIDKADVKAVTKTYILII